MESVHDRFFCLIAAFHHHGVDSNYDGSGELILEIAKRFSRLWRLGFGRRTNRDSVIPYNPVNAK